MSEDIDDLWDDEIEGNSIEDEYDFEFDLENPCHLPEEKCEKAISILKEVNDPEIPVNVYDMGMIYDVRYVDEENDKIRVIMTFTSPFCPAIGMIVHEVKERLKEEFDDVQVDVVWEPKWDKSMMKDEIDSFF